MPDSMDGGVSSDTIVTNQKWDQIPHHQMCQIAVKPKS